MWLMTSRGLALQLDKKSGSGLLSPDKLKAHRPRRLLFAYLVDVAFGLEGLGAPARSAHLTPRGKRVPVAKINSLV
jgi:hypothetical protein